MLAKAAHLRRRFMLFFGPAGKRGHRVEPTRMEKYELQGSYFSTQVRVMSDSYTQETRPAATRSQKCFGLCVPQCPTLFAVTDHRMLFLGAFLAGADP